MPNLLYDAQQTRYGQLVTNSHTTTTVCLHLEWFHEKNCGVWNIFTQKLFSSYIPTSVLPFSTTSTRVWLENNMTTTSVLDKKKYSILSKKKLSAWSSSSKRTTIVSQTKEKKVENLSEEEEKNPKISYNSNMSLEVQ